MNLNNFNNHGKNSAEEIKVRANKGQGVGRQENKKNLKKKKRKRKERKTRMQQLGYRPPLNESEPEQLVLLDMVSGGRVATITSQSPYSIMRAA